MNFQSLVQAPSRRTCFCFSHKRYARKKGVFHATVHSLNKPSGHIHLSFRVFHFHYIIINSNFQDRTPILIKSVSSGCPVSFCENPCRIRDSLYLLKKQTLSRCKIIPKSLFLYFPFPPFNYRYEGMSVLGKGMSTF